MKLDDPASRLHTILKRVANTNDNNLAAVWSDVLGTDNSQMGYYHAITKIDNLFNEVEQSISNIKEIETSDFTSSLKRLKTLVTHPQWNSSSSNFKESYARMADATLALKLLSNYLQGHNHSVEAIEKNTLESLRNTARSLIDETTSSDLPESLKSFIIDHLFAIEKSLTYYNIFGANGITKSIESAIGGLVLREKSLASFSDEPNGILQRVKELIDATIAATPYKLMQISLTVSKILSIGNGL